MVTLSIDQKQVTVPEGTTILEAAKSVGIKIPTLCYLKDLNEVGACRVCMVEIEGAEMLSAACSTLAEEGMVVYTNSKRARSVRRTNVELLLSRHYCHCPNCPRSGNCSLQSIARDLNIYDLPFEMKYQKTPWDPEFPLIRDNTRCIKCLRCINVCRVGQSLGVWDLNHTSYRGSVEPRDMQEIRELNCALCGQCITHCPVGALRERDDTKKVFAAINDPEKVVVAQIAPAVRTSWGEEFGLTPDEAQLERLVYALKAMGINYVFPTAFTADLTIMEEGSEFLARMQDGKKHEMPMFTSCCPGWVRFLKYEYPELVSELSSAKSPQQMFGAMVKTYFAERMGIDPKNIFSISVMPCVAKKYECDVPEVNDSGEERDVDAVLTTRELSRMIRTCSINIANGDTAQFDSIMGTGTGAGMIFGATGGVMEAALRSAHYLVTDKNPEPDAYRVVRAESEETPWREAEVNLNGITVKAAVASGLGNARRLIEALKAGTVSYDFVEIMACPGGCSGGGGQTIHDGEERAYTRGQTLYHDDANQKIRFSHENPDVQKAYELFLEKPLSHKAHELLHTDQSAWTL